MGLAELALVSPKHFPHEEATARASGADDLLAAARVSATLADAIGRLAKRRAPRLPGSVLNGAGRQALALTGSVAGERA